MNYDGDLIKSLELVKNKAVRPLWLTMESQSVDEMLIWVDRFDSLCPISSEWALAQAIENSCGVVISERNQFVRTIFAEINRLVYLTTYLSQLVQSLNLQSSYQQGMILREKVFQQQEELMGGRILPQVFKVGGLRRGLAIGDVQKVQTFISQWKKSWSSWKSVVLFDPMIESRLENLLVLSKKEISRKCFLGIVGKASGVFYDARLHQPHGAYALLKTSLNIPFDVHGDALSRFNVAVHEVDLSLSLCEELLSGITAVEQVEESVKDIPLKEGIYSSSAESARGPVTSLIEVNSSQKISSVRLFNSSQRVWPEIEAYFLKQRAEDFQLAWNSLGFQRRRLRYEKGRLFKNINSKN
jgi:NADH-quinone oxidoreductase subunit D